MESGSSKLGEEAKVFFVLLLGLFWLRAGGGGGCKDLLVYVKSLTCALCV